MAIETQDGIKVVYDPSILRDSTPFRVSADQARINQLLLGSRVPQERINEATLLITQGPPDLFQTTEAVFSRDSLSIRLFPDVIYEHQKNLKSHEKHPTEVLIHELKHLINYVQRPNYERGTQRLFVFANNLAIYTFGITILGGFLLSAPHILAERNIGELNELIIRTVTCASLTMTVSMSSYYLNPVERDANRFARRMSRLPQWQSLLSIIPKN